MHPAALKDLEQRGASWRQSCSTCTERDSSGYAFSQVIARLEAGGGGGGGEAAGAPAQQHSCTGGAAGGPDLQIVGTLPPAPVVDLEADTAGWQPEMVSFEDVLSK